MNNLGWRCTSLVDVSYIVGDDTRYHVADQLHTCIVKLDVSLGATVSDEIRQKCREVVEKRVFTRLAYADENYGVVGLKRWSPRVRTMVCQPVTAAPEVEDESDPT